MKYIKTYENNRFEYGDYIIYKKQSWKNTEYPLVIMSIHGSPGSIGSKYDYYDVNELYEFINGELKFVNTFNPLKIDKEQLEKNTLYHAKSLDDAKSMIFIINDANKYNL